MTPEFEKNPPTLWGIWITYNGAGNWCKDGNGNLKFFSDERIAMASFRDYLRDNRGIYKYDLYQLGKDGNPIKPIFED